MKKLVTVVLSVIVFAVIGIAVFLSCKDNVYTDISSLTEKAREEFPIADVESIDISYAGQIKKDDKVLLWFISGNEHQSHYYLPMECTLVGENEYKFERTYKPITRSSDIAVLEWNNVYAFIVNDPDCKSVHIEGEGGAVDESLKDKSYPYVFYYNGLPTEYEFFDADGQKTQ